MKGVGRRVRREERWSVWGQRREVRECVPETEVLRRRCGVEVEEMEVMREE